MVDSKFVVLVCDGNVADWLLSFLAFFVLKSPWLFLYFFVSLSSQSLIPKSLSYSPLSGSASGHQFSGWGPGLGDP